MPNLALNKIINIIWLSLMMKTVTKSLRHFIKDFKLEAKGRTICFDALIYFKAKEEVILLPTEVHILNIGKDAFDVLYLLHHNIALHHIPDIFDPLNEKFTYSTGKALIIKGTASFYGSYTLSIHPTNKTCSEETLKEIHSKTYN